MSLLNIIKMRTIIIALKSILKSDFGKTVVSYIISEIIEKCDDIETLTIIKNAIEKRLLDL